MLSKVHGRESCSAGKSANVKVSRVVEMEIPVPYSEKRPMIHGADPKR